MQPFEEEEISITVEASSDDKILIISVAARMAGMHPQTLRQYDRLGLVQPGRAAGGGRRYSARDVALLREVQRLSQDEGINLEGIRRIISLEQTVGDLREQIAELEAALGAAYQRIAELETVGRGYPRADLVPTGRSSTALVVWRPRRPADPPTR
ncbi:helix-turn-helix transcriptional regulator [Asanoa sp. WMMD1127]|uniref:heat shock protein transcriptional repressor HspR n=1 Tax=Asanoa sp. WMMD1127 TaxID=3016107 RepID=UPI002415A644|nr:helix-turn-helix transcriptional regulator [Asanoa sp. WMMD1127]MDG4822297.1 helix-turn-helix transcriptional regulator [Asanoa sp. WMMD1127]